MLPVKRRKLWLNVFVSQVNTVGTAALGIVVIYQAIENSVLLFLSFSFRSEVIYFLK